MDTLIAEWLAWTVFWKEPQRARSLVINRKAWPSVCRLFRDVGGDFLMNAAVKECVQYPNTVGWSSVFYGNAAAAKRVAGYVVLDDTASFCANMPHAAVIAGGDVPPADAVKAKLILMLFAPTTPRVLAVCVLAGAHIPRHFVEWVTMSQRPPLVLVGKKTMQMARNYLPPGLSTSYARLYSPGHAPDGLLSMLQSKDPQTRAFTRARLAQGMFRYIIVCDCTLADLADWSTRNDLLALMNTLPGTNLILGVENVPMDAVRKRPGDNAYWWLSDDDTDLCIQPPPIGAQVISASSALDAGLVAHARRLTAQPLGGYEQAQAISHRQWLQGLACMPLAHEVCSIRTGG